MAECNIPNCRKFAPADEAFCKEHHIPGPAVVTRPSDEVRKLKPQYPDYVGDPDGLAALRQDVQQNRGHDMAVLNYNSLGRLIDTIERLRSLAALSAIPADPVVEALASAAREVLLDCVNSNGRPHIPSGRKLMALGDALAAYRGK